ncbi:MAG: twin-arginine translocase subunit TatC [Solirubrobacterales bacterium]
MSYEDRLTLVEHLDELRSRLIVSAIVFTAVLAVCFWQNGLLLDIANAPLPNNQEPITIGVSEPFTTTLTVSAYAAIVLTLPFLLYQTYAFVLPAMKPSEKKVILPFLLAAPLLFISGVVFGYFIVLPAAAKFLLNFNDNQFNIQVRAREYYSFFGTTLLGTGVLFQAPIGILALTRLGIVTTKQLSENRRYAILAIAVVAMLLPGTDPVTMLLSMVPLIILFEGSLLVARALDRGARKKAEAEAEAELPPDGSAPGGAAS